MQVQTLSHLAYGSIIISWACAAGHTIVMMKLVDTLLNLDPSARVQPDLEQLSRTLKSACTNQGSQMHTTVRPCRVIVRYDIMSYDNHYDCVHVV